jgi:uncharacterized protein (TIGR02246 family)
VAALPAVPQTGTNDSTQDHAAVLNVLAKLSAADRAGDLEAVLRQYADDAILMPPNSASLSGQAGVRTFYEAAFSRFRFEVSFDADEAQVSGDWAFVRGFINGRFVAKNDEAPRKLHEKFIMVLHRQKDAWNIFRIIWNSSEPPAAK